METTVRRSTSEHDTAPAPRDGQQTDERAPHGSIHDAHSRADRLDDGGPSPSAAETRQAATSGAEGWPELAVAARHRRMTRYERFVKPAVDRGAAALLLLILSPVFLALAATVALRLGFPVFLRQRRVGRHGDLFTVYKFRTMHPDRRSRQQPIPHTDRRRTHKSSADPRHTRVGRLLRKSSADELPQLLNVIRGDMSLVGPRPELPEVVGRYEPWQHVRHRVKPGLTGLWQVSARGGGMMHENPWPDIDYVNAVSAGLDAGILLRTPKALFRRGLI